jgi:Pyruvate/2-oxoacid:ferredoxin oxidoreductase delta subunit
MDKNKGRGAVRLPACLSIVSKGAWYELGLKTKIEIHLDQCKDCPMSETLQRLQYSVSTAAEWLQASGHIPPFSYIHQSSHGKTKRSWLAIETGLKITSRRDLFVSLIKKGKQLAGELPRETSSFPGELDEKMHNRCLPGWQRRLAEIFQKNRDGDVSPAYWPTIEVNEGCVNCGMCSHYCPSGTLQITVKGGVCTHHFTSGFCLDCRICQLFCPGEAIRRDRQMVDDPFEVKSIYSSSISNCRRCGSITMHRNEDLCFWCKQGDTNDNEMKDSLKKILLGIGI